MLESKVQSKIIKDAQKKGWFALKVIRCNVSGFTDLVLFGSEGRVIVIECKAKGKVAEELQKFRHKQLKALDHKVYSNIDTWEKYLAIGL